MNKAIQCTVHLCKSIKLSVLDSARTFFFPISTDTLCLMIKLKLGKLTYYGIHMSGFSNSPDRFCWAKISLDHYPNKAVLDKKTTTFLSIQTYWSKCISDLNFQISDQCVLCSGEAGCIVVVKTTSISLSFFVIRQQGFLLDKI